MRFATASELRSLDAAARAAAWSAPGADPAQALMRLAALALADTVSEIAVRLPVRPEVLAVAGGGDNGGDALLALELLAARGFRTTALRVADAAAWAAMPPAAVPARAIVLDGILGLGLRGAPRPDAAAAIDWTNRARDRRGAIVVAVDLPSGLDPDTGAAPGPAVRADFTVTMGLPKPAFAVPAALARCGEIRVADIAYPDSAFAEPAPDATELFAERDLARVLPPRAWDAHKGDFGHVALVVGSERYSGAGALAALGALRGGAGLVTALVPRALAPSLAARAPELMVRGYDAPHLSPAALASLGFDLAGKVVLAGCGLSTAPGVADGLRWILSTPGIRGLVLDADALTLLGRLPPSSTSSTSSTFSTSSTLNFTLSPSNCILTPHPGEAARLLGVTAAKVQADRPAAARELAARSGATVVLKGAGTLVAAPNRPLSLVAAGNPGLAKGGSGDLLAGLCAALLARGLAPFDAARAAALLHGRAADLAVLRGSPDSFLPSDLLGELRFPPAL